MSLNSNTQELNEILEMANNLPLADEGVSSQGTLIVKASANFMDYTLTDLSPNIFSEIEEAYNNGIPVTLEVDMSQLESGQKIFVDLTIFKSGAYAVFNQVVEMSGMGTILVQAFILADNSANFTVTTLSSSSNTEAKAVYVDCTLNLDAKLV